MPKLRITTLILSTILTTIAAGCGGGGGGGGSDTPGSTGGERWEASAAVASDTCGERIANVRQIFTINDGSIDTSIISLSTTEADGSLSFGFTEANGDCQRTYQGVFANFSGTTAEVAFSSTTQCPSFACESTWVGTAARLN